MRRMCVLLALAALATAQCPLPLAGEGGAKRRVRVAREERQLSLSAKVDRYLRPVVAAHDFSGVVLIARGESPLVSRSYGMANVELGVPMGPKSRFRVASITKTFTGAAIAVLAERGQLAYDDPLAKFIPGFPNADKVKIRHLLLHRSGYANADASPCGSDTFDAVVNDIGRKPLAFEPGTQGRYSNGGYALLARVVEKASGKNWADFLREDLSVPAGLSDTTVDRQGPIIANRVRGYVPGPGSAGVWNAPCDGAWAAFGSGDLISTASDLHRWARAVRNERLFKRTALEHPYGWGVRKYFDRDAIEQSGIENGAASYLAAYPSDDVYVVVLSNVQSGLLNEIGKGLAALTFGEDPPALVLSPPPVASSAAERKRWIGRYNNPNIANIEIDERSDALYLRWGNSTERVYLTPSGPLSAFDRQDSIALELTPENGIRMRWPQGEPQLFARLP